MACEIPVEPVRPGVTELAEPVGRGVVCGPRFGFRHVQARAEITEKGVFALHLRQPADGPYVIALHAGEVILGLGVDHPEYGVSVGLAVDVWDAEVVADDRHASGAGGEARLLPIGRCLQRGRIRDWSRCGVCAGPEAGGKREQEQQAQLHQGVP